jgi:hypothetical protein
LKAWPVTCGTDDPGMDIAQRTKPLRHHYAGANPQGAVGRMSTHTPGSNDDQKRLDIARRLYQALVAQDPDRLITLCDGSGLVLARNERRRNEDAAEKAS